LIWAQQALAAKEQHKILKHAVADIRSACITCVFGLTPLRVQTQAKVADSTAKKKESNRSSPIETLKKQAFGEDDMLCFLHNEFISFTVLIF
jgi:hypothetical protein